MTPQQELQLFQSFVGLSVKQIDYRLALLHRYIATKQLNLRIKVTGLNIGD